MGCMGHLLYLPLNFAVNLKVLLRKKKKKTLLKKKKMGGDSKQPYKDVNWQNKGSSTQGH